VAVNVFLDSSVIIAAVKTGEQHNAAALREINNSSAVFVSCRLVVLETTARMRARGFAAQATLADAILAGVSAWVDVDDALVKEAEILVAAAPAGLGAVDAMLAAAAMRAGAVFVTCEKRTKPLFSVPGLRVRSLHP
jgi:predicted nucleic acid-binding protein